MAIAIPAPSLTRGRRLRLALPQSRSTIVNRAGFALVILLTLMFFYAGDTAFIYFQF